MSGSARNHGESSATQATCPAPTAAATTAPPGPDAGEYGRYLVLEPAGKGGMGRVLRAYDPRLQREVALKLLHAGATDPSAGARLVRESRAMAKLSHPNVVEIYDVEVPRQGSVMLVMHYAGRETLGAWLAQRPRPWQEILDRFVEAGRGLAAAHAAGLLHRDFKPSNVLLGARVMVADFGLAVVDSSPSSPTRATQTPHTGESSHDTDGLDTASGAVVGTSRYMSPEQHCGTALGPATDQYSFCVALFEALSGSTPFSGEPLLAAKLQGPPSSPTLPLPRRIRDALERGLRAKPARRWPTMASLLDELTSVRVRIRRRRRRRVMGLAVAVASASTWAAWGLASQPPCTDAAAQLSSVWDDEQRTRVAQAVLDTGQVYAPQVAERATAQLDEYATNWTATHTEVCEETTVEGRESGATMMVRMRCLRKAKLALTAVTSALSDPNEAVTREAHKLVDDLPPPQRCLLVEVRAAVDPPRLAHRHTVEAVRSLLAEAKVLGRAGQYDEALAVVDQAMRRAARIDYGPLTTEIAVLRGKLLNRRGSYQQGEDALRAALRSGLRWGQRDEARAAATGLMYSLGALHMRPAEALRYREVAMGLAAGEPRAEGDVRGTLAVVLANLGRYAEAEVESRAALAAVEEVFGARSWNVASARSNFALLLRTQGRFGEAESEVRRALEVEEELLGTQHPAVASTRAVLANILFSLGRYEEARQAEARSLADFEATLGPEHPSTTRARDGLGNILAALRRYDEAEQLLRDALASRLAHDGATHPAVARSRNNLATVLAAQGRLEEAEIEEREALRLRVLQLGPDHPLVASSRYNLADTLARLDNYEAAEREFRRAVKGFEAAVGRQHPRTARAYRGLASLLLSQGRAREALPIARRGFEASQREDILPTETAEAAFIMARALSETGDRRRARAMAQRAQEAYRRAGEDHEEDLAEVTAWLSDHR